MSREMAAEGPNVALTEQMIDALYQTYQDSLAAHAGQVSPATATRGVIAASANMLVNLHGLANPEEEEELVSWEAFKDTCVEEFVGVLSEPKTAGGTER